MFSLFHSFKVLCYFLFVIFCRIQKQFCLQSKVTYGRSVFGGEGVAVVATCRQSGYTLGLLSICWEQRAKKSVSRILLMRSSSRVSMELLEKILYTLVRWHESFWANHTTVLPCSSRVFFISSPMCIVGVMLNDSRFSGHYKQKRRGNQFCLFCNPGSSIAHQKE